MANTTCTITVVPTTKTGTASNVVAVRETIDLTIVGAGIAAGDVHFGIVHNRTLMAHCTEFAVQGDDVVGTLNLNTVPLVNMYNRLHPQAVYPLGFFVWDTTNKNLPANGTMEVMNNPHTTGMTEPEDVDAAILYIPKPLSTTEGNIPQWTATTGELAGVGLTPVTALGDAPTDEQVPTAQAVLEAFDLGEW